MSALRDIAGHLIALLPPKLQPMARWRFIRFGLVGASGTVINIAVLAFLAGVFVQAHCRFA